MKEAFKRWLSESAKTRGVTASGVRFADRDCVSQTRPGGLTADQLRDIWQSVSDVAWHLAPKSAAGQSQRWTFEKAQILVALRADGVMLGVISAAGGDDAEIAGMLDSFLGFEPAA